jgi:hypothetical protein
MKIKHVSDKTLYVAKDATSTKQALEEAVSARAYLDGANLHGANLDGAYLGGANLGGANLHGAYLGGTNLGGANLRGANLGGAYLGGAYLGGANLDGANLRGANLGGAVWKQVADLLEKALHGMNDSGRHWIKGSLRGALEDGSATYCSIGSVEAHGDGTVRAVALWLLGLVCGGDIAAFNDHPDTTWDDVVVVFNIAVKHARRFAS